MIHEFKKIMAITEKFNKAFQDKIFSDKEIKEQTENINDFIALKSNLNEILNELLKLDPNDKAIVKLLVHVHAKLVDTEWHVDELHGLIKRLIKFYTKKLPNDLKSLDD